MKNFKVSLTETLYTEFIVKAKTKSEAEELIRKLHNEKKIILTTEDKIGGTDYLTEESDEQENLTEYLEG